MKPSKQTAWIDAQSRCRLSDEAVAMAKELGMSPRSLIESIPNRSENWMAPVEDWVRGLHERRFGQRPPATPRESLAPPPPPAPVAFQPEAPPEVVNELEAATEALLERARNGEIEDEALADEMDRLERETPVSEGEIADQDRHLLRRRDGFRRFADFFAGGAARLDFVQRIVLFGSVAAPLKKEIPRFSRMRRARIAVWHECKDVDLALWLTDLARLRELKRVVADATNLWQEIANQEGFPGIPHHQVDLFLLEAGTDRYRGNLCRFGQCPKGKPECAVPGCGAQPFLQLYEGFRFDPRAPYGEHAVVLFDRFSPPAKT